MESLSCSSEEAVCHLASLIFWPTQCLTHFGSATPHLELVKSTFYETSAAAYFLTIKASQKKEKESANAVELSSWISGKVFFFPPLYHPVDSFSDSYKTHPTLVSVFHWIGWRYLLYWLTLRNCFEQISQISRVKHSNIFKHERYVEKR